MNDQNRQHSIRDAGRCDLDRLAALESRAFKAPANRPWTEQEFAAELCPGRCFLVAEQPDGDGLIGYCLFKIIFDEAELLRMAVLPHARRRGVGRALLQAALERVEKASFQDGSIRGFILEVRADNQAARALYKTFGFALEGRRPGYYPDGTDALLLRRKSTTRALAP